MVIYQPFLFNHMASADVRSPCGEFAKRQGIIHFAFAKPRKLNYKLLAAYSLNVLSLFRRFFFGSRRLGPFLRVVGIHPVSGESSVPPFSPE